MHQVFGAAFCPFSIPVQPLSVGRCFYVLLTRATFVFRKLQCQRGGGAGVRHGGRHRCRPHACLRAHCRRPRGESPPLIGKPPVDLVLKSSTLGCIGGSAACEPSKSDSLLLRPDAVRCSIHKFCCAAKQLAPIRSPVRLQVRSLDELSFINLKQLFREEERVAFQVCIFP